MAHLPIRHLFKPRFFKNLHTETRLTHKDCHKILGVAASAKQYHTDANNGLANETDLSAQMLFNPKITPPRQSWVENFVDEDRKLLDIIDLHPRIFGVFPRIDHLSNVIQWQQTYREIDYVCMPTRNELPGGTRRPWPQKGTGRARHKSVNSPIWIRGGWARGPRGPVTNFRLLPNHFLVNALRVMLTIKLAQDDLKIVDSIDTFLSDDPQQLEDGFSKRRWGPSVLIVDYRDTFPDNLVQINQKIPHINFMTTYGLNTLSMSKHETLVMTLRAIREVESRLINQLLRVDLSEIEMKYRDD